MLSVLEGCFEAVLARHSLALEHCDGFVPLLADVFKFSVHVGHQLVLLLLSQSASGFALDFWEGVHGPLHAVDLERARYVGSRLRLPYLAKQENVATIHLFVGVKPEEGQRPILICGQTQSVQCCMSICGADLRVQILVLQFEASPVFFDV